MFLFDKRERSFRGWTRRDPWQPIKNMVGNFIYYQGQWCLLHNTKSRKAKLGWITLFLMTPRSELSLHARLAYEYLPLSIQ